MDPAAPSRTALAAAMHRAAHQSIEGGTVFGDPFAHQIIGAGARARLADWAAAPERAAMRMFIAARHRLADDKLAAALAHGIKQVVIVGAGLDTTALRQDREDVRYFEVDHPATQAWKGERLAEAQLAVPENLTFAPVDFEAQSLADGLASAGFDAAQPAFFVWLGVVPYLTRPAIFATLRIIAEVAGSEVVFDYANPPEQLAPMLKASQAERAARVAAIGEPWVSFFDSAELAGELRALGTVAIEDYGPLEIQRDILRLAEPRPAGAGGHVLWARWSLSRVPSAGDGAAGRPTRAA
jgi:methyltransferase (TIGR00027 family)